MIGRITWAIAIGSVGITACGNADEAQRYCERVNQAAQDKMVSCGVSSREASKLEVVPDCSEQKAYLGEASDIDRCIEDIKNMECVVEDGHLAFNTPQSCIGLDFKH